MCPLSTFGCPTLSSTTSECSPRNLIYTCNQRWTVFLSQCRWRVRCDHHDKGHSPLYGKGCLDSAGYLQVILRDWCAILSLWSADVLHEVWFVDLRWRSGMSLSPSVCLCVRVCVRVYVYATGRDCEFMGNHLSERWARAYKPKKSDEHWKGVSGTRLKCEKL